MSQEAGASAPDDRPDTYWIERADQIAALTSMRRHDIGDRIAASGPMSIKELAEQIGVQPSALYHHVKIMLDVGLLVEAGSRIVRRKREQLYAAPGRRMRLIRALASGEHQELMEEVVAAMTRQMDRDFRVGGTNKGRKAEGDGRNYGFFRLIGRPGKKELARINACLQEVAELLWEGDDPEAELLCLGWVLTPLPTPKRRPAG
jgi:DNA-binding transcriptional ArsR family regulator